MVYSIIKRHEGHITVQSAEGAGSIFEVYLPAVDTPAPLSRTEPSARWKGRGRVLVMDDEASIRSLLSAILTHYGFQPVSVSNGQEAVHEYAVAMREQRPFTAVILDVTIPGGMGGKEAIKELRMLDPNIKAIVSSGYSNDPVLGEYDLHGFCGRMEKPYRADEVGALLKSLLQLEA